MNSRFNLILIFCLLFFLNCTKEKTTTDKKHINLHLAGNISTLDPALCYDVICAAVIYQTYETMFEYHYLKRPYVLIPSLAEDMPKIENDGKKYTFKIKKNIFFHDAPIFKGVKRELKAKDFVTAIKRLAFISTRSPGWWLLDGKIVGIEDWRKEVDSSLEKFQSLDIKGVTTPDDYTLVLELTEAYPQLLYAFAMTFLAPVPLEAVVELNNNLFETIFGTGPYTFVSWVRGSALNLTRNLNYREAYYPTTGDREANELGYLKDAGKRIPFIDTVTFNVINEEQTAWLQFRSKNIDILVLPKDNFSTAVNESGNLSEELTKENVKFQLAPRLTYWWLAFNMTDPILGKNKNLRMAFAHAIDFKKMIQIFTNNVGQEANSIYPPGIPGYDPSRTLPYEFNVEKAKEYLKNAGYPEGKGLPVFKYDVRGNSTLSRQTGSFIETQLKNIGIKVEVVMNTFPAFLEKTRNGQLQIWQDGWAMDYPDAENVLQLLRVANHPPGPNTTYYSNPKFEELFLKLKTLNEGVEKTALMKEMEDIVNEDVPWVMEYYARTYILEQNYVMNYRQSDVHNNYLKYINIEKN